MTPHPVDHINLLQRSGPTYTVVWWLMGVLVLALAVVGYLGTQLWSNARQAQRDRDAVTSQLQQAKARLAALNAEKSKSVGALALRQQVDTLQPQSLAAQALVVALRGSTTHRAEAYARPFELAARTVEPGVWLTQLSVSDGGRRVDLTGQARDAEPVMRYVQRMNEALVPMGLRLNNLEIRPSTAATQPGDGPKSAAVMFQLN